MAKDYAKRVFTTTRSRRKKTWRAGLIIIPSIILVLLLIIYVTCSRAGFFKMPESRLLKGIASLFIRPYSPNQTSPSKVEENAQQEVHFDFYNALPNMRVSVQGDVPKTVTRQHDPEAPLQYILQLGVFDNESPATQLRISLLLAGCEAEIVKIKTKDGELYRVQSRAFSKQADAKKVQEQWQAKGVTSVLKKA
jgi:hypothetical protein